jgi:hypothetical protein
MKAIGGYFELELPRGKEYHQRALRLNSGRNAFEHLLRSKEYNKVFLPYYTCDAMLGPIHKLGLEHSFYNIDETMRPVFDYACLRGEDVFVYNNYFGVCDLQVKEVANNCKNLVVDNSQAFFSMPQPNVDTFYSPRKFFGVPDGAYLYTDELLSINLEKDNSFARFDHLIKRIDVGSEFGYAGFKTNEAGLANQPIKLMSRLTQRLLESIEYLEIAERRKRNFKHLHTKLKSTNGLSINMDDVSVPMVYPYFVPHGDEVKNKLISQRIFVATYWPNVLKTCPKNSLEYELANRTVFLPVDQRYGLDEMDYIYEKLKNVMP